jgi:hypothetical protein
LQPVAEQLMGLAKVAALGEPAVVEVFLSLVRAVADVVRAILSSSFLLA